MKLALCVPPAQCDVYGHLSRYADQVASVGRRRGVAVEILQASDPAFPYRLFANLADPQCIVHFHCFLYDLRLVAVSKDSGRWHAIEAAKAVTLATISDHPFTQFMNDMVCNAHPRTRFMVIDDSFAAEMRYMNPALENAYITHTPFVPPVNFDPALVTPFEERQYDLVVPLFLTDMTDVNFAQLIAPSRDHWMTRIAKATYDIILTDLSRNPFHVFEECLGREIRGVRFSDVRAQRPDLVPALIDTINVVDSIARQERRHRMIRALLKSVGDLQVAVMADPVPSLQVPPNVKFVGRQPVHKAAQLMANARAILNCNPTYQANIHERVSVGMMYGACVITDLTPCLTATFSDKEYLAYGPDSGATLTDLFASHGIQAIAAAGAAKIKSAPEFTWEAEFARLMSVASAPHAAAA